ncbi:unnamed protein product [Arctia plantaginis]|uniref:Uncharacterized protein n=1 Tax=Arctia plantaginis TaxID=874455 RepID=A0A8S0YT79_ARCPL|nr:unnamed protein product [Arctia plantaginis]
MEFVGWKEEMKFEGDGFRAWKDVCPFSALKLSPNRFSSWKTALYLRDQRRLENLVCNTRVTYVENQLQVDTFRSHPEVFLRMNLNRDAHELFPNYTVNIDL